LQDIELAMSTAYDPPQTNEQIEVANRSLDQYLRAFTCVKLQIKIHLAVALIWLNFGLIPISTLLLSSLSLNCFDMVCFENRDR